MKIFITGGAKNGKSTLAQKLCKQWQGDGPLYYLATMIPHDAEDRQRILRHRREREGWGFTTLEQGVHLLSVLDRADPKGTFLLDSVTALLSNEMFPSEGGMDAAAPERLEQELRAFVRCTGHAVLVSDYLYADAGHYDPWTEAYRRGLARLDRMLAAECDAVAEVCASNVLWHKGGKTE